MKKLLLTLGIIGLIFCGVSFAADTAKVFDGCGPMSNYKNEKWYSKLEKQLTDKGISTTGGASYVVNNISEACYSNSRNQVIMNVPVIETSYKKCTDGDYRSTGLIYCSKTLNIFSYNTKNNKLSQAALDSNTIYTGFTEVSPKHKFMMREWAKTRNAYYIDTISKSPKFNKRIGEYIILSAGFGDAGCYNSSKFRYYYKSNIIKAESTEQGCMDNIELTNYINKTTKKIKAK